MTAPRRLDPATIAAIVARSIESALARVVPEHATARQREAWRRAAAAGALRALRQVAEDQPGPVR